MKILIVGSYFSTSSFSKVNSSIFEALKKKTNDVFLLNDEKFLDYKPSKDEISRSKFKDHVVDSSDDFDVVFFFHFPKSIGQEMGLSKFRNKLLAVCVAWEDLIYPKIFVQEINNYATIVLAISHHVRKVLIQSGVCVPIYVLNHGVDLDVEKKKYPLNTLKTFKFLNISTGKRRKGLDLLIKAYDMAFTSKDDVVLILKTSNIPDNDTQKFLDTRVGDAEIIHIQNSHLLDSEISYIQSISHCHVYPSRCEGFCLPAIESMAHGKLTIATRYSGFLDFCNDENSILIDYAIQSAVDSEFVFPGSKWAEPDVNDLAQKMRFIYDSFQTGKFKENFSRLMKSAFETAKQFSWDNIAERLLKILKSAAGIDKLKSRRFVKITPYNDQTGIAEYSKQIVTGIKNSFEKCWVFANDDSNTKNLEDEDYVVRNWTCGEKSFSRVLDFITDNNVDTVHIQFHSSTFFSEDSLSKLIKCLKEQNIKVFLTLHSVVGKNFDHIKNIESLNLCDKVLVTSKSDLHYARKYISNVVYAPLFVDLVLPYPKPWIKRQLGLDENETLISTHGLLNTNKSVMQIIEGFQIFLQDYPNSKLVLLNAVSLDNYASTSLFNQIKSYLKEKTLDHKVLFISDFLDVNVVNKILNASDIYVLAYTDVGESGSAAVKKGLQNEVVTVVTDIKQFDEYKDEVIKIPDNNPETIATILKKLKSSPDIYKSQLQKIKEYNKKRNIVNVQVDHLVLYL